MTKYIYYITMEGINSTVFKSQVYELLNSELAKNFNITLICFQPINIKWNNKIIKDIFYFNKISKFKLILIPYIGFKGKLSLINSFLALNVMAPKIFFKNNIILHCRAQEATRIALLAKNINKSIKIISDIRSVPYEELKDRNIKRAKYFKKLDEQIFNNKNIDYYNFISNKLREYYIEIYSQLKDKKSSIIPCFSSFTSEYNSKTKEREKELNILYVGGQQFYQNIDKIPSLLNKIKNKKKMLLCLSGERNKELENKFNELGINNEFYYNLNSDELDKIYKKSDIGIVIRENIPLNIVASPVKISEYFSKGLYVMLIGKVGDFYNDIIKDNKLGIAYENIDTIESINLKEDIVYEQLNYRKEYANKFSKQTCIDLYRKIYNEVSRNE